jgi:hypothetical protein
MLASLSPARPQALTETLQISRYAPYRVLVEGVCATQPPTRLRRSPALRFCVVSAGIGYSGHSASLRVPS